MPPAADTALAEPPLSPRPGDKRPCRLCYYDSDDTQPMFGHANDDDVDEANSRTRQATPTTDWVALAARHLYLRLRPLPDQPHVICWMCTQVLVQFEVFYAKINKIQRQHMRTEYAAMVIDVAAPAASAVRCATSATQTEEEEETREEAEVEQQTEIRVEIVEDGTAIDYIGGNAIDGDDVKHDPAPWADDQQAMIKSKTTTRRSTRHAAAQIDYHQQRAADDDDDDDDESSSSDETKPTPDPKNDEATTIVETEATSEKPRRGRPPKCRRLSIKAEPPVNDDVSTHPVKRGRGRPRKSAAGDGDSQPKSKRSKPTDATQPESDDSYSEGESEDDLPAESGANPSEEANDTSRTDADDVETSDGELLLDDNGDTDWARMQVLGRYPEALLNAAGLLQVRGAKLMRVMNKFYTLTCDACVQPSDPAQRQRYRTLRALFDHHTAEHAQPGHVSCCGTRLSRYTDIIMHMVRHLQPEWFRCPDCGYQVTRPRFLAPHRQTHLPDELKPFGCDRCEKRFCWKRALKQHVLRAHDEPVAAEEGDDGGADAAAALVADRRRYVCQECGKIFGTSGGLSAHRRWSHGGGQRQEHSVCHICAKIFATRAGLNEHMELHRPREQTQLQCTVCAKWLMNARCLKTHMILHSAVELQCPECDYRTKKTVLMNRHRVNKHSDEKPFECAECGKRFKLKRPLTVHMQEVHVERGTERRKFECEFCGQAFNSSTNFYTHRKRRHPEQLAEVLRREAEVKRRRRIEAGVEAAAEGRTDDVGEDGDGAEQQFVIEMGYEGGGEVPRGKGEAMTEAEKLDEVIMIEVIDAEEDDDDE